MPRNEDGEFELILGNRQLLSVFFIVVILLGVFFTMGYIVGRNSSPLAIEARRSDKPPVVDAGRPVPGSNTPSRTAERPSAASAEAAKESAQVPVVVEKVIPDSPKKEPEKVVEKPKEKEKKKTSVLPDQPAPGEQYLQIVATGKSEAELFIDVLAKKGFHALISQVPDKDLYRVLVGPYKDTSAVAQARDDLEKAGFQGRKAYMRKY